MRKVTVFTPSDLHENDWILGGILSFRALQTILAYWLVQKWARQANHPKGMAKTVFNFTD